jgi:hypothetical protein
MNLNAAEKQFTENLCLFGNANTNPEKFNLYSGLVNLTKSLRSIENDLRMIMAMQK